MTTKKKEAAKMPRVPQGIDATLAEEIFWWADSVGVTIDAWGRMVRVESPHDDGLRFGLTVGVLADHGYRTVLLDASDKSGETFRWLGSEH